MSTSKTTLKTYFETGDKPTQTQFAAQIDALFASKYKNGVKCSCTSNTQVLLTAAVLAVSDIILDGVGVTVDITVSGAGGLDTGVETANTWYSAYIICNNDATLISAVLSVNTSAPTLPVGYTKSRKISAVRNNSAGNFIQYEQDNAFFLYSQSDPNLLVYNGGGVIVLTEIDLTGGLPTFTSRPYLWTFLDIVQDGVNDAVTMFLGADATNGTLTRPISFCAANVATEETSAISRFFIDHKGNSKIDLLNDQNANISILQQVAILGFEWDV